MQVINKKQIAAINACLAEIGRKRGDQYGKGEKAELMLEYSGGRSDSTTGLTFAEARRLIMSLNAMLNNSEVPKPGEKMRRNIIAMAHEMQWELPNGKADMNRINGWVATFGYLNKVKHSLNEYTEIELPMLVTQFKKVYQSYLKGI